MKIIWSRIGPGDRDDIMEHSVAANWKEDRSGDGIAVLDRETKGNYVT